MPHPAAMNESELLADCEVRRQRRSGPGGQHRNKVETAIFIEHTPTGIIAEASERRSQEANRRQAIFRLRVKLAVEVRSERGEEHIPSELWKSRCQSGKIVISAEHDDFPPLLAEALDCIQAEASDVKSAAEGLGCSASQLVKFLAKEPLALAKVNEERKQRNLRPLK